MWYYYVESAIVVEAVPHWGDVNLVLARQEVCQAMMSALLVLFQFNSNDFELFSVLIATIFLWDFL